MEPVETSVLGGAARCWICGDLANTREHRIKKSSLLLRYGRNGFTGQGGAIHRRQSGDTRRVQGPGAQGLTYAPSLCAKCNNETSQPWDRAFEQFEQWILKHEKEVLTQRFIPLDDVFGADLSAASPALYKYFVKAFGCRLVDAQEPIPQHLVQLLGQDNFKTALRLTFSINQSVFALSAEFRGQLLGAGDLVRHDSVTLGRLERYTWHLDIGWLRVWFWHHLEVPSRLGAPWTSDSSCLYLGEFEDISLSDMIESARNTNSPALAELEALRDASGIRIG